MRKLSHIFKSTNRYINFFISTKDKIIRAIIRIQTLWQMDYFSPRNYLKSLGCFVPGNYILAYWSICARNKNFGDVITPYIIKKITNKTPLLCSRYCSKEYYILSGSIIGFAKKNAIVWGAGILSRNQKIKQPKKILAVRGPITRERLLEQNIFCPEIYGDPALLLPRFYMPNAKKEYKLGIIPHYTEYKLVKNNIKTKNILIINLLEPIEKVINDINKCNRTISSSLHGIITSHAYGVPSIWVKFYNKILGDGIKFKDYFLSVRIEPYDPIIIDTNNFQFEKIISLIDRKHSQKIQIDLDKLLAVCPFK